jgi:hypothetical protein
MFDDVVTRCVCVLRICVGVLRDVTVLAEMSSAIGVDGFTVRAGTFRGISAVPENAFDLGWPRRQRGDDPCKGLRIRGTRPVQVRLPRRFQQSARRCMMSAAFSSVRRSVTVRCWSIAASSQSSRMGLTFAAVQPRFRRKRPGDRNVACSAGDYSIVARLRHRLRRLSVPPNSVVKCVESIRTMSPAR